jgi:hypothetical protein
VPALILTALIVAAQSFGPMAALYSAGARVERLRYAPSVLHPRITVDIADDYGLSRWSRLTVNLSGVYLQLALVLATCLVAIVTGAEFRYLTVALVTLNMVRLLLPFGRPDADRLLRDALLVDDPLRYAGATLARRIPGIVPAAPSLPALKRWGHLAIWLYLAVAALLVLMLGAAVLWATPTVLVTLRDALLAHLTALPEAIGERDVLGIVGGVIQSAVLVLAVFVLAVLLVVGARRLVVAVWAWSRRGPSHRRIAGVGALVLLLVVALAWIPIPAADAPDAALSASPRSLAGVPFRPLTYASRGTLFDLFRSVPDLAP